MSTLHRIEASDTLECRGVEIAKFTAAIEFRWYPGSPNTWDSPGERATAELHRVTDMRGASFPAEAQTEWAEQWLEANVSACAQLVRDAHDAALADQGERDREERWIERNAA